MIRRMLRRPVAWAVGLMAGLLVAASVTQMAVVWWAGLPLVQRTAAAGVGALLAAVVLDRAIKRVLRFSPIVLTLKAIEWMAHGPADRPTTGREIYESGATDVVARAVSRSSDGAVPVDAVYKRDPAGPATPELDRRVSISVFGQTGTGKSSFVKSQIAEWNLSEPVIAHALSEPGAYNEFSEFFEDRGAEVLEISSRNSDVRWDPLLDSAETVTEMENIASAIFSSRNIKITGWSEAVRSMLIASVVVTSARHGDFAHLTDVIEEGADFIIEEIEKIPNAGLIAAPLRDLDESDIIYRNLLNRIRPILVSDICDESLDRLSLEEYFAEPDGRVVVLDNVTEDDFAEGFWRFFLKSSIDVARRVPGRQQFVVDEVPALPEITNLKDLASAGRSAGVRGIIVAQDAHQMEVRYGTMSDSIWANTPNTVMFRPGDAETAQMAIETLGEVDLHKRSVSAEGRHGESKMTRSVETGTPLLSGDLMDLDIGEALISSPSGWWLCKIEEPKL